MFCILYNVDNTDLAIKWYFPSTLNFPPTLLIPNFLFCFKICNHTFLFPFTIRLKTPLGKNFKKQQEGKKKTLVFLQILRLCTQAVNLAYIDCIVHTLFISYYISGELFDIFLLVLAYFTKLNQFSLFCFKRQYFILLYG